MNSNAVGLASDVLKSLDPAQVGAAFFQAFRGKHWRHGRRSFTLVSTQALLTRRYRVDGDASRLRRAVLCRGGR